MLFITKINGYVKLLTDEKVKNFVATNFSEYFTSIRVEENLRKVNKSSNIFLATPNDVKKSVQSSFSDNGIHRHNVEILNIFDPELQLINTKPVIETKLKEFLSELTKFIFQTILILGYKRRNDHKTFYSNTKLIASESNIDETFQSMHYSIMARIKDYTFKDCF